MKNYPLAVLYTCVSQHAMSRVNMMIGIIFGIFRIKKLLIVMVFNLFFSDRFILNNKELAVL